MADDLEDLRMWRVKAETGVVRRGTLEVGEPPIEEVKTNPQAEQSNANPHPGSPRAQESYEEEGQQQADRDIRVELVVLNRPAKLPVPLAKRNPPIHFVVEQQQRQQEHRGSTTPVHATPQCQHSSGVFNTRCLDVLRLVY